MASRTYRRAVVVIRPEARSAGGEGFYLRFKCPRRHKLAVNAMACQNAQERQEIMLKGAYVNYPWNLPPDLTMRKRRELMGEGNTIRILLDPWAAAHYYGWDAHLAFEGGR